MPESDEGAVVWKAVQRCTGQVRRAGMAGTATGIEMEPVLRLAGAAGLDPELAADLLGALEAGLLQAQAERSKDRSD